jgi:ABC-type glycerol-3-phosphate transport system substrate-binding protein
MKKVMKKFLKTLCFAIIFMLVLTSCGNDGESVTSGENAENNPENVQENENNAENQPVVEERQSSEAPVFDLGGADFVIMVTPWGIPIWNQRDIAVESEIGEVFNDAVFRRNSIIEERYNTTIVERVSDGLEGEVRRLVQAGDDSVDAVTPRLRALNSLSTGGSLVEFSNLTHIDLDKPWWDKNSADALSVVNRLFAACSDITVMDNDSTSAFVFNKQLLADYSLEDPYQMVKNNTWTFDTFQEMTKQVSEDLSGEGVFDDRNRYGLLYQRDSMTSFLVGANEFIAQKDSDDMPVLTLNNQKALDVLEYLYDFLYDQQYCFHVMRFFDAQGVDFTLGMNNMFQNNQALFMWIRMADVENLRTMDTDFGILPIPKWNAAQDNYLHNVNPHVGTVTAVPQSARNIEISAAVLDALAAESRYLLYPAYYDIALNSKITRDEESSEMLDVIFSNRRYDIGDIYDFAGLGNDLIYMTTNFERNIVSRLERSEPRAITAIERMVDAFESLD